jgi:hypothetical protein
LAEKKDHIKNEVDDRLEYLFSEDNDAASAGALEETPVDPLRDLKAIFLAVEWEINDDIMSAMIKQIDSLKETFKTDQIMVLFLQLLAAVGKYVKSQKANSHPDAIKLLNSIYTSLEIVSMSHGMTETERKKILRVEVSRFKKLKEKVARKRIDTVMQKPEKAPVQMEPAVSDPLDAVQDKDMREALLFILKELRKTIRSEFKTLQETLKSAEH